MCVIRACGDEFYRVHMYRLSQMHVECVHFIHMHIWGDVSMFYACTCVDVLDACTHVCLCVCRVDTCISEHAFPHTDVYWKRYHASVAVMSRYDLWSLESAPSSGANPLGAALLTLDGHSGCGQLVFP